MDDKLFDEKKDKTLERLSRREFIRRTCFGVIRAAGFNIFQYKITQSSPCPGSTGTNRENNKLQVRDFAEDIYSRIRKEYYISSKNLTFLLISLGFFLGDAGGGYLVRNLSTIQKRSIALATGTIGSLTDAESTYLFARHFDDKRFFEYGFDSYFCEKNPDLGPDPIPSKMYYISAVRSAIWAAISFTFPFLGRGYFGASPVIAMNNAESGVSIKRCLNLGDNVKSLIEGGKSKQEIRHYIKNYRF